jgi:hypothetical protein
MSETALGSYGPTKPPFGRNHAAVTSPSRR